MMGKSQLVDVIKHLMKKSAANSENANSQEKNSANENSISTNPPKKIVALYAPAIAAQFKAAPGQLEAALKAAGFDRVWEVAIGADICADNEAREFEERMARGDKMMTSSCCPAYVRAVRRHVPALAECISETKTPMHYTAELAKKADPGCITVFIGPCLAKRREGFDDEMVDYVLSTLDLESLFIAKEIDVSKMQPEETSIIPTASGRNFAKSGGVAEAVEVRLKDKSILRAAKINGLTKSGMKMLNAYGMSNSGKIPSMHPPSHAITSMRFGVSGFDGIFPELIIP